MRGGKNKKDLTNKRFGKLIVIEEFGKNKHNRVLWLCKCDCGNDKVVDSNSLLMGRTQSCGCLRSEIEIIAAKTHGMTKTRFYNIWLGVKNRCTNENEPAYKNYGGRGIKCLWSSFEEFKNDMYQSYQDHVEKFGEDQTTIDRIDNSSDYCKENCRWATYKEQQNNRRTNHFIEVNGETLTLKQASEKYGIKYTTIQGRLVRGKTYLENKG